MDEDLYREQENYAEELDELAQDPAWRQKEFLKRVESILLAKFIITADMPEADRRKAVHVHVARLRLGNIHPDNLDECGLFCASDTCSYIICYGCGQRKSLCTCT